MNKRFRVAGLAFAVTAVVVLSLVLRAKRNENLATTLFAPPKHTATPNESPLAPPASPESRRDTKADSMQAILGLLNHKAISFYGQVVDQRDEPVPDVDVYASVIYNTGAVGGTSRQQTKTDAKGNFFIGGLAGGVP